jgi:hypothetical protein
MPINTRRGGRRRCEGDTGASIRSMRATMGARAGGRDIDPLIAGVDLTSSR